MAVGFKGGRPTRQFLALSWSIIGLIGPAANRLFLTWGSGKPPINRGVSSLSGTGPIGEAIIPQSAAREDAAIVCSITLKDGSIISRFWVLISVLVP